MKKLLLTFVIFSLIFQITILPAQAYSSFNERQVSININGQRISTDAAAFIRDGSTLVPLRGIFEKLRAQVEWLEETREIRVTYGTKVIGLQIDSKTATVNESVYSLDVAPIIYNSSTMIPLRFISENLGMSVGWVDEASLATITEPGYFENLPQNMVLGFTTRDYQGDTSSYQSLKSFTDRLGSIATFSYGIRFDGSLVQTGLSQVEAVNYANKAGLKPLLLIHNMSNGRFNKDIAHSVLSDNAKRGNLVSRIISAMSKEEYTGVNIDLENLYGYDRQNYTSFIKELKEALSPLGYLTTVSIPAKTSDGSQSNNWTGAFDYAAIGRYADRLLLMTYDQHYFGGAAGPVASAPWVEDVIRYATSVIPSSKILMGIPGYGYDWSSQGNRAVTFNNVEKLMRDQNTQVYWDDDNKSPHLTYTRDGFSHEVWYENQDSLAAKLKIVRRYSLGGIGIWRLGYDNQNFWDTIKENLG